MLNEQLWIEAAGNIIVARVRGIIQRDHDRGLTPARNPVASSYRIRASALRCLEMEAPDARFALLQEELDREEKNLFGDRSVRKAILVSDTRLAYLARIAFGHFGEGAYCVFYNDLGQALRWLEEPGSGSH
jgi:hypothetical protein